MQSAFCSSLSICSHIRNFILVNHASVKREPKIFSTYKFEKKKNICINILIGLLDNFYLFFWGYKFLGFFVEIMPDLHIYLFVYLSHPKYWHYMVAQNEDILRKFCEGALLPSCRKFCISSPPKLHFNAFSELSRGIPVHQNNMHKTQ